MENFKGAWAWLKENNINYIGSPDWGPGDEKTNNDSRKIVNELYELGATKVEVDIYNPGDEFACEMRVTLPEDEQKAREVMCCIGELHADDVTEKDGVVLVVWGH